MAERMMVAKNPGLFRWRGAAATTESPTGTFALARTLWLLILAQFITTLPASASNIFVPVMAADVGRSVALIGALRGLGGLAALACGVLAAPLIDRSSRAWTVACGVLLLALGTLIAAQASVVSLALFYLLFGLSGAIFQPALKSAAADGFDTPTGARAAALLTACGGLAPMLAGPLFALTAGWLTWRGIYAGMAALILAVAALAAARLDHGRPTGVTRTSYCEAFRLVAAAPGALPLLLGSTLRAILQLAWLSYLAAYLAARFGATSGKVALTWGMGGACFFLANLAVGRLIAGARPGSWRSAERLLPATFAAMLVITPLGLIVPSLPLAMVIAALTAGTHGAAIGTTVSVMVGRYTALRGAVLSLNAAGANLGTFAGAALGGIVLGVSGYSGLALALAALVAVTLAVTAWALRKVGACAGADGR